MNKKGLTLIELLVVIGIIAILATIIYVAVDPARRMAEARNAARRSEVNSILNAVLKYINDYDGVLPGGSWTNETYYMINDGTGADFSDCTDQGLSAVKNLEGDLVDEYLSELPKDPDPNNYATDAKTYYYIKKSLNNRITVGACKAERGETIKVAR